VITRKAKTIIAPSVYLNAIGTAAPAHDIHQAFIGWATERLENERERKLFARMSARSGISHRWSVLPPADKGGSPVDTGGFYAGTWPGTGARMQAYQALAPDLAQHAVEALAASVPLEGVTHLVLASCTGFTAPGVDQMLAARIGLPAHVERLLVGYMGCYAAVAALRSARHIVRSEPKARVLVVCIELCTLHLQAENAIEPLLAALQFGDGAAAALVSADPAGLEIGQPFASTLPGSQALIRWDVGDHGFAMHLSGEVPAAISTALGNSQSCAALLPVPADTVDGWAVHAGGRSILDAVEHALDLEPEALDNSRAVLDAFGNMSSATLMFVLERILRTPASAPRQGIALAFGPGVAAEGFAFSGATP
jgi:predicted naringenin-chalcone synthase